MLAPGGGRCDRAIIRCGATTRRGADPLDDRRPLAAFRLAEQARARIPRRVVAIEQPAEIGRVRNHQRERPPERAGQVRDRRVDAHHAIHQRGQRGRIREILERVADEADRRRVEQRAILVAQHLLQAHPFVAVVEQRQQVG
ncbi:hypothetical protein G3N57_28675, partial [Paraburkholderia sp. Se-20369]|nr:hypothetical protein [Paraburkholderia sp. Se-20369]